TTPTNNFLTASSYTATAQAADGTSQAPQAGVKTLQIKLDSTVRAQATGNSDNASANTNFQLTPNQESEGEHALVATAEDRAQSPSGGNLTTKDAGKVYIDRSKPNVTLSGSLSDSRDRNILVGTY